MVVQPASTRPLRILIVEDDAFIGSLLAEMLEDMGHSICSIEATEAGAVGAALRDRPDLMIVDARLREGSGIGAVETIRLSATIPYVLMSGAALPARCAGAVTIAKPFKCRDLADAMVRAMELPGARNARG